MLLIEQVDRLSRLTSDDWTKLRAEIDAKRVRIVALDLPTSWRLATPADEFTGRVFQAINSGPSPFPNKNSSPRSACPGSMAGLIPHG